jgi:putative Ca2+/H+ antiporter (TMEM165/GDT1 family)
VTDALTLDVGVILTVLGLVFVVELPDKTMVATLVLANRYRPLPVLVGVGTAFVLQMGWAVAIGGALSLLPKTATLGIVAALFGTGAVFLVRESMRHEDESPDQTPATTSARRIAMISFGVLLLAEFGDGSQLATGAMAARYGAPLSVFIGAWLGEMTVCTIAAFAGRALLRVLPVRLLQRAVAVLFTGFAVAALVEIVRS